MQIIAPALVIGAPRLAGGPVSVEGAGLLIGGLHGHDPEMWSKEWQLAHHPSALLAMLLKH